MSKALTSPSNKPKEYFVLCHPKALMRNFLQNHVFPLLERVFWIREQYFKKGVWWEMKTTLRIINKTSTIISTKWLMINSLNMFLGFQHR